MNYTKHPNYCTHQRKVGECLIHNWHCPDCGFGVGQIPGCNCNSCKPEESYEPAFGTHIREAVAVVKEWMK